MFGWWEEWQKRRRLAEEDATILIARFGVRASHMARRRVMMMNDGEVFDSNRPACHWKRVYSITRQLLPYDGDDGAIVPSKPYHLARHRRFRS
jgi:hypothetical protein